jgi:hypothetical protein
MPDDPPADLLAVGETGQALTHNTGNAATGGIWRVDGPRGPRVLKICQPGTDDRALVWGTSDQPHHWNYWQREPLAYRSGLVASVYAPSGLRGPRLLDSVDRPDGSIALWLEYVIGEPGSTWTVAEVRDFTRRLGAAQAAWLDRPAPYPWLSVQWLRQYCRQRPLSAPVDWDHPALTAAWPAALRTGLARLAANREALLAAAERAPRTVTHLDAWPMNLILAADGPVLLDWAFVGDGALGEDVANLIVDSVADGLVPVTRLPEVADAAIGGYLDGIGDAADPAAVRCAVYATGAAKYAAFGPTIARRVAANAPVGSPSYDVGGSPVELLARWRPMLEMLVDWGERALPE